MVTKFGGGGGITSLVPTPHTEILAKGSECPPPINEALLNIFWCIIPLFGGCVVI